MKIERRIFVFLCGVLVSAGAAAQEAPRPSDVVAETYTPVEPLQRSAPTYPAAALDHNREGWVRVSFIISEEGKVIEPMIEESSNNVFDESALRAIEHWRYKPATVGGKPVEQSMVQTIIRYQLFETEGASVEFVKKYRIAYSAILAKNLAKAGPLVEQLEKGPANYYEDAWLWWLKYVYLDAMGGAEPEALITALSKALGSSPGKDDAYLQPDVFVSASQRLYVLSVRANDFSGALTAFERLTGSNTAKRSKNYESVVATLEPSHGEIMNAVAGPKVLQQTARVDEHHYWVHRLLRRSFAFGDVQAGKLEVVDVRCTRENRRFVSLPEDAVLKIPDTWGDCRVYIKGDVGTVFSFEEYPDGYANAVDPAQLAPNKE
ncbi:MAG TPA: energy transducer TonB [Gammaproteobacteria bacterium]|nr:energy transducer TonB [Gammaproteobacteria bacterium]